MARENLCDRIEEFLDDVLSDGERAAIEDHLDACEECRAALADYRRLRRLALAVPPVEIPDDLGFQIRRRLAGAKPPKRRPVRVLYPAMVAAAAVAAGLLITVLVPTEPEMLPPKGPTGWGERSLATRPADPGTSAAACSSGLVNSISDWLVQAGNAADDDHDRLLAEARENDLLARIRAAAPAARGTERDAYLTAVSDLLVQLENDSGAGRLREEARLVAMVRPR